MGWKWDGGVVVVWEDVFVLRRFKLKYLELKWTDVSVKGKGRAMGRETEHKWG